MGEYLPANWGKDDWDRGAIRASDYETPVLKFGFFHRVVYNLHGIDEHWEVEGTVVNGRIPLPSIPLSGTSSKQTPQ